MIEDLLFVAWLTGSFFCILVFCAILSVTFVGAFNSIGQSLHNLLHPCGKLKYVFPFFLLSQCCVFICIYAAMQASWLMHALEAFKP